MAATQSRTSSQTSAETLQNRPNTWKRGWQAAYRSLGFQKGYNFPLWIVFGGAMLGFCLARLSYLNVGGDASSSFKSGAAPGEWFHYNAGYQRVGITLHLAGVIPAGLLMVWQFLPIIRHKALLFHRLNGYLVILLVLVGNAGALMIARDAFGGTLATQTGVGLLAIITTLGMAMAWYNIKKLQIDQHRAWMLRTMFYLGVIITLRIILGIGIAVLSKIGGYWSVMPCSEISFLYDQYGIPAEKLAATYPSCINNPSTTVAVKATLFNGNPEEIGGVMDEVFGMALWLALFMHLVGVEIYLRLTPREAERLRQVSYEKQLEKGMKQPGSAGLVVEKWGDAEPWTAAAKQ